MTQENIIKMLAGANKVARASGEILKTSSADYIEKHIIQGKYVSREEYEQLHKLVLNLQKEVAELRK